MKKGHCLPLYILRSHTRTQAIDRAYQSCPPPRHSHSHLAGELPSDSSTYCSMQSQERRRWQNVFSSKSRLTNCGKVSRCRCQTDCTLPSTWQQPKLSHISLVNFALPQHPHHHHHFCRAKRVQPPVFGAMALPRSIPHSFWFENRLLPSLCAAEFAL